MLRISNRFSKNLSLAAGLFLVLAYNACGAGSMMGSQESTELSSQSLDLDDPTAVHNKSLQILNNQCSACHFQNSGPSDVFNLTNPEHLLSSGLVIAGDPASSPIYQSIQSNQMPPGQPLSSMDKEVLRIWIEGGAQPGNGENPDPQTPPVIPPPIMNPPGGSSSTFTSLYANVFYPRCVSCHSDQIAEKGVRLHTYENVLKMVKPGSPSESKIYQVTQSGQMPQWPNLPLTSEQLKALSDWISAGAQNN